MLELRLLHHHRLPIQGHVYELITTVHFCSAVVFDQIPRVRSAGQWDGGEKMAALLPLLPLLLLPAAASKECLSLIHI